MKINNEEQIVDCITVWLVLLGLFFTGCIMGLFFIAAASIISSLWEHHSSKDYSESRASIWTTTLMWTNLTHSLHASNTGAPLRWPSSRKSSLPIILSKSISTSSTLSVKLHWRSSGRRTLRGTTRPWRSGRPNTSFLLDVPGKLDYTECMKNKNTTKEYKQPGKIRISKERKVDFLDILDTILGDIARDNYTLPPGRYDEKVMDLNDIYREIQGVSYLVGLLQDIKTERLKEAAKLFKAISKWKRWHRSISIGWGWGLVRSSKSDPSTTDLKISSPKRNGRCTCSNSKADLIGRIRRIGWWGPGKK